MMLTTRKAPKTANSFIGSCKVCMSSSLCAREVAAGVL